MNVLLKHWVFLRISTLFETKKPGVCALAHTNLLNKVENWLVGLIPVVTVGRFRD